MLNWPQESLMFERKRSPLQPAIEKKCNCLGIIGYIRNSFYPLLPDRACGPNPEKLLRPFSGEAVCKY